MKALKYTLIIAVAAIAMTACKPRNVKPKFTTVAIDTLLGDTIGGCNVEWRFVSIANAAKSPSLEAIEWANIQYFFELEDFEGGLQKALDEAMRQIKADYVIPVGEEHRWLSDISAEAEVEVVDTLMTYVITRSSYTGGAHGMYSTECHTYALNGGYEVSSADLFDADQLQKLVGLIRTKIYEQYNAKNDEELSAQGFFPEYIGVTENFRVTPKGITFYFSPYEIAAYVVGSVDVEISNEELKNI